MTLLITLGDKSAIHQSSDYCLSNRGRMTETANVTKQLSLLASTWYAKFAFTGIATDGQGYSTTEWLNEEGVSVGSTQDPAALVDQVARRGTDELKRVTNYGRGLTIVVAVAQAGRCRLFLVSNFEGPKKNRRPVPLNLLRPFELDLSFPVLLVNGMAEALPRWEKKHLDGMFRSNPDPEALRARIAAANKLAAMRPGYGNSISEGCWVTSIFANGHSNDENYGQVGGLPSQAMPGFDASGYLRNTLRAAPGRKITIVQGVSVVGRTTPVPPETGEPREINYSTLTTSLRGIGQAPYSESPRLVIAGRSGTITLRKNVWVPAVLNTVTFEIDPSKEDAGGSLVLERQRVSNVPTVAGAQPRNWDYEFDFYVGGGTGVLSMRKNTVALRSAICSLSLDAIGPDEGLEIAAPSKELIAISVTDNYGNTYTKDRVTDCEGLILTVTRDAPKVSAQIEAMFLLRDFPE